MDFHEELASKSAPRIRKAAEKIAKQNIQGHEEALLTALDSVIENSKSWQAQSKLIRAIGVTGSDASIPKLKELASSEFESTILYIDLGFAICRLNDLLHGNLEFIKSILHGQNTLLIAGACSASLYEKTVPSENEMLELMDAIETIDANEGQVITPRCYIAALAYLWPPAVTKSFLELCLESNWNGLVEIAESSINGEKPKYVLV